MNRKDLSNFIFSHKRFSLFLVNYFVTVFLLTSLSNCILSYNICSGEIHTSNKLTNADNSVVTQINVIVDNNLEHQIMEGFGATHGSLVHKKKGDVLSSYLRTQAIDAVYNQVGISMGNLEVALLESPGTYDERTNDNDDPFNINWKGFQTFRADVMKRKVFDLAEPFGFDNYFLGQKINVRWASGL